jgi:hypothetical protein
LLLSRRMDQEWDHLPTTRFYEAVLGRAPSPGRRIRWLPTVLDGAAAPRGLPDHLRSFDWYSWSDGPRPQRRADLIRLLGGVLVDRSRS